MILVLRSRKLKGWAGMDEFFGWKEDFDDTLVHGKQFLTLLLSGFNHVSCLPYLEKNSWQNIFLRWVWKLPCRRVHYISWVTFGSVADAYLYPIYLGGLRCLSLNLRGNFFSIIRQFLKQVNLLVQQGSCGGCLNLKYLAVCLEGFCDAFHGRRFEACWSWVCPGEVRFYEGGGEGCGATALLMLNNYYERGFSGNPCCL